MGWKAGTNLACRLRACWYACSSCCTYDESCFRTPPISSSSPASEFSLPYPSSSSSALISQQQQKAATGKYRNLATFSITFPRPSQKGKPFRLCARQKKKEEKKEERERKTERDTPTHTDTHTHTHTHTQTQIHTHTHTQTQIHIQAGTHTGRHTSR